MDKSLPETESPPSRPRSLSGTRDVLLWLIGKEGAASDEQVEAPEPSHEDCKLALAAEHARLKKTASPKDQKDPSFIAAMNEYGKQYRALETAIEKKTKPPAAILLEIPKLQAPFRRGLALFPVKQAEAAKSELASLKESSSAADSLRMDKLRAAEKAGLFELEKELTTRKRQIATLQENLGKQTIPKTRQETTRRIAEAEQLKGGVETKLEALATVKSEYEDAVSQNDSLREKLKASQQRFDELAEQQQAQLLATSKRAAQLEARCELIQKDNPLPESISRACEAVPQDIDTSNVVNAGWALDDLEGLLDAEEKRLRETHPGRDGFLAALAKLEQQARLIEEEDLASETYRAALEKKLAALRLLATQRKYAEALEQATQLLEEVQSWIEAARQAQTALEEALNEALDDIAFYEEGETVVEKELTEMHALVEQARSRDDLDDALEFVTQTVHPKIKKFLQEQAKWRQVSAPVRERRPRQPPNYDEAARRIVDDVLRMFGSSFRYAGPSLNVQELYPRERYNPGRLKQAVRTRFASLAPAALLPGKGLNARCYFNLGAGGTTKKKYEYNVKVKREGVDQALAQIHIVYP